MGRLVSQQRRRLADTLAGFDESQWNTPSRCEEWSVRDVIAHLTSTNQFWTASISSARSGSPTRMLTAFDPVATPAAIVDTTRHLTTAEVLDGYRASVEQLAALLADLSPEAWSRLGESPAGHVQLRAVALHALWDAWTHERDIMLPLGLEQVLDEEEIRAGLIYASVISPILLATQGSIRTGTMAVEGTAPRVSLLVELGATVTVRDRRPADEADAELHGSAVDLIEGLTLRTPLDPGLAQEHQWMLGALADAFKQAVS